MAAARSSATAAAACASVGAGRSAAAWLAADAAAASMSAKSSCTAAVIAQDIHSRRNRCEEMNVRTRCGCKEQVQGLEVEAPGDV